jgi:hypothetical protein
MNIYEKRGKWYAAEEGKDVQIFNTEAEAKVSVAGSAPYMGVSEMDDNNYFECGDCECDPCECGMLDDELEEEDEDEGMA